MLTPFDKPALALDQQPRIGPVLLEVGYSGQVGSMVPPAPSMSPVVVRLDTSSLDAIYRELLFLRADLKSRTVVGRLTRAWQALKRVGVRLWSKVSGS